MKISALSQSFSLKSLEQKIIELADSLQAKGPLDLLHIIDSLEKMKQPESDLYSKYWHCYALYRLGNYYAKNDLSESKKIVEKAISILDADTKRNSEDNVLIGMLTSYSIKFYSGNATTLSAKARKFYDIAIGQDAKNMRAYFAIARTDYNKPVEFGGGKIVEQNILKALSLKNSNSENLAAPTWGREDAYILLINFYIREERLMDAQIFCNRALQEFPNSVQLKEMKKNLEK